MNENFVYGLLERQTSFYRMNLMKMIDIYEGNFTLFDFLS